MSNIAISSTPRTRHKVQLLISDLHISCASNVVYPPCTSVVDQEARILGTFVHDKNVLDWEEKDFPHAHHRQIPKLPRNDSAECTKRHAMTHVDPRTGMDGCCTRRQHVVDGTDGYIVNSRYMCTCLCTQGKMPT